jgi:hypothetical protein
MKEKTSEIIRIQIDWDCTQRTLNEMLNLDLIITEYSLLGVEVKKYSPYGNDGCLK